MPQNILHLRLLEFTKQCIRMLKSLDKLIRIVMLRRINLNDVVFHSCGESPGNL